MRPVDLPGSDSRLTLPGLLKIVIAVCAGVILGLTFTIRSLDLDVRGVTAGIWRTTPRDGSGEVDPYALAANARAGLLPLGNSEGLTLVARTDGAGDALSGDCDYQVKGPMPPTRDWTLSLLDLRGFPLANAAERYGFTSSEVLRLGDMPAAIVVSPEARSGNWLPSSKAQPFVLMLRLYDTSLSSGHAQFDGIKMPSITRIACR